MTEPAAETPLLPGPAAPRTHPLSFWRDESGQDLIEYGLATFLLGLCAVAALHSLSAKIVDVWTAISTSYSNAM